MSSLSPHLESLLEPASMHNGILWMRAFVVLAVGRSYLLLPHAGMPPPYDSDFAELMLSSARFVRSLGRSRSTKASAGSAEQGLSRHLRAAFGEIQGAYGEDAARTLLLWLTTHCVDEVEALKLWDWTELLPPMLAASCSKIPQRESRGYVIAPPVAREALRLVSAPPVYFSTLKLAYRTPRTDEEVALEKEGTYQRARWTTWGSLEHAQRSVCVERVLVSWKFLEEQLGKDGMREFILAAKTYAAERGWWTLLPTLDLQLGIVSRYACPCCGFLTFHKYPAGTYGSYDICPVCFWEDDAIGFRHPDQAMGANKVSLHQARDNFRTFGAKMERAKQFVRRPRPDEIP